MLLDDAMPDELLWAHGLEDGGAGVALGAFLAHHYHGTPLWHGAVHKHILPSFRKHMGEPEKRRGTVRFREKNLQIWDFYVLHWSISTL